MKYNYIRSASYETYLKIKITFEINNRQMYITASNGVALYPKDGTDSSTILKNADSAMYKQKN